MMGWLAWAILAAALAGALVVLYAWLVERARVQLSSFTVQLARPGLPPDGLTILHLSDLHFRARGHVQARKIARVRRLLAGQSYDLLALTGDLIHDTAGFPAALGLIEDLKPRLGGFSCPGNHDYAEYSVWGIFGQTRRQGDMGGGISPTELAGAAHSLGNFARKVARNELVRLPVAFNDVSLMNAALQDRGILPLVNQAVHIQANDADLWIAGVDDLTEGHPDLAAALAGVPEGVLVMLLAHNPDIWLDLLVEHADLVLSGHTHGGQVRVPLIGAAHTQGTHLTRRQAAGWYQRGQSRMFVSRGLGESIPFRLGVRPQIALIHLVPQEMLTGSR